MGVTNREDIELGDEPVEVERPRRTGIVLSVRLSPEEADHLQQIAEVRGLTLSKVAREALMLYLRGGGGGTTVAGAPITATLAGDGQLVFLANDPRPTSVTPGVQTAEPETAESVR
jgi:hypothetical protein